MAIVNVVIMNNKGGSVDVYKNDVFVASVTSTQNITYSIGDSFRFQAKPLSGYVFEKFCGDSGCIINSTSNPLIGTITAESGFLYAYFKSTTGCPGCDITNNICLSSIGLGCVPKLYLYGAVAAVFAFMVLRKR